MMSIPRDRLLIGLSAVVLVLVGTAAVKPDEPKGEWHYYSGDAGATKYSPLDQINAANVRNLRIAWRHPAVPREIGQAYPEVLAELPGRAQNLTNDESRNNFETTPLMANGILYTVNGVGLVESINPVTGVMRWLEKPPPTGLAGVAERRKHRGIGYWKNGTDERILSIRGRYLIELDAKTGNPRQDFGDDGQIDLAKGYRLDAQGYGWSGFPLIIRDLVVVAGHGTISSRRDQDGHSDTAAKRDQLPLTVGDIRAYDVRSGKLRWTFHVVPQEGEFGNDTWQNGSWKTTGGADSWATMSADPELGYIYVPLDAPEFDWYGGGWPGNNLFADSLVCLNAETGKRVWHFQIVHHDIWDLELPASPILTDITVNGQKIKAVVQVTKQGFAFVFDRVTGKPVWPIEERPVPKGNTPGEWYSPTQPFPTKPPPFDRQGVSVDDLIDFTPELHAEAVAIAKQYVIGPLYTPGSLKSDAPGGTKGTLMLPSWLGGANWDGAAFDPETGILYVPSMTGVVVHALIKGGPGFQVSVYDRRPAGCAWPLCATDPVRPAGPAAHEAAVWSPDGD